MKNTPLILLLLICLGANNGARAAGAAIDRPNIVYILCDDLGYGDVHALNPERCKIPTPNFDRLAATGMTFTDCHSLVGRARLVRAMRLCAWLRYQP